MDKMIDNFTQEIDHKLAQLKSAQTQLEKETGWLNHDPDRIGTVIALAHRYKKLVEDLDNLQQQKQLVVLLSMKGKEK